MHIDAGLYKALLAGGLIRGRRSPSSSQCPARDGEEGPGGAAIFPDSAAGAAEAGRGTGIRPIHRPGAARGATSRRKGRPRNVQRAILDLSCIPVPINAAGVGRRPGVDRG